MASISQVSSPKISDCNFDASPKFDPKNPNKISLSLLKDGTGHASDKLTITFPENTDFSASHIARKHNAHNLKEVFAALVADNTVEGLGLQKRSLAKALQNFCQEYGATGFSLDFLPQVETFDLAETSLPEAREELPAHETLELERSDTRENVSSAILEESEIATPKVTGILEIAEPKAAEKESAPIPAADNLTKEESAGSATKRNIWQSLSDRLTQGISELFKPGFLRSRSLPGLGAVTAIAAFLALTPKTLSDRADQTGIKADPKPVASLNLAKPALSAGMGKVSSAYKSLASSTAPATARLQGIISTAFTFSKLAVPVNVDTANVEVEATPKAGKVETPPTAAPVEEAANPVAVEKLTSDLSFSDFRKLSYYLGVGNNSKKNGAKEFDRADLAAKQSFGIGLDEAIKLHKSNPDATFKVPSEYKEFLDDTLSERHSTAENLERAKSLKAKLLDKKAENKPEIAESKSDTNAEGNNTPQAPAPELEKPAQADSNQPAEKDSLSNNSDQHSQNKVNKDNLPDATPETLEQVAPKDFVKLFAKLATNNKVSLGTKPIYYLASLFDVTTEELGEVIAHRNNKDNVLVEVSSGISSLIKKMNEGASQQDLRQAYNELGAQKIDWDKVDSLGAKPASRPATTTHRAVASSRPARASQSSQKAAKTNSTPNVGGGYDFKTDARAFEIGSSKVFMSSKATTYVPAEDKSYTSRSLAVGGVKIYEQGSGYLKILGVGNSPRNVASQTSRNAVRKTFQPVERTTMDELIKKSQRGGK